MNLLGIGVQKWWLVGAAVPCSAGRTWDSGTEIKSSLERPEKNLLRFGKVLLVIDSVKCHRQQVLDYRKYGFASKCLSLVVEWIDASGNTLRAYNYQRIRRSSICPTWVSFSVSFSFELLCVTNDVHKGAAIWEMHFLWSFPPQR